MYERTNSISVPDKREFADIFRLLSRISYWIHLLLGVISGTILLLVTFSRDSESSSSINIGILLATISLISLGFRVYWALRYRNLAKKLQKANPAIQPSRKEIIRVLRLGLLVSFVGLFFAFIASEISLFGIVTDALARPQGVAIYEREQVIRIGDLLLVLAQLNILGAHFFGSANSLGLLNWITKE